MSIYSGDCTFNSFSKLNDTDKQIAKEKQNNLTYVLPDPTGPLSTVIPTSSISDANQEVLMIYKEIAGGKWQTATTAASYAEVTTI